MIVHAYYSEKEIFNFILLYASQGGRLWIKPWPQRSSIPFEPASFSFLSAYQLQGKAWESASQLHAIGTNSSWSASLVRCGRNETLIE